MTHLDLTFGFANLGRGATDRLFRLNLHLFLSTAAEGVSIVGLAEIDEADQAEEREALRAWSRYRATGMGTSVPILSDRRLEIVRRRVTQAAPGLAGFTPRRHVVELVVTVPGAEWLGEIAFLVTHVPIDRPQTRWRRARVRARLGWRTAVHRSRGRVVARVADLNARPAAFPRAVKRERVLFSAPPDAGRLWTPRRIRARVVARRTVDLTIDRHDGHLVTVRFQRRRGAGRPGARTSAGHPGA